MAPSIQFHIGHATTAPMQGRPISGGAQGASFDDYITSMRSQMNLAPFRVGGAQPVGQLPAMPGGGGGERAAALGGAVQIQGPDAERVAASIEALYATSPTFRQTMDAGLAEGETYQIQTGNGGNNPSFSTLGQGNEQIYLNLDQTGGTDLGILSLAAHELGHGAGNMRDAGALGEVGENQQWLAQVMNEMTNGVYGPAKGYGSDVVATLPGLNFSLNGILGTQAVA